MTGDVVVHAHLRQARDGGRNASEFEHRHVQAEASNYELGRDRILAELPAGWIVASWRVE